MQKRLIFLISQPRAGSTMLQRMLWVHPDIHTISEPWIMLPTLYWLHYPGEKSLGVDERLLQRALMTTVEEFGNTEPFVKSARLWGNCLYQKLMEDRVESYFLDKTPRYAVILPSLLQAFPDAKWIFLLRNPLAVIASLCASWNAEKALNMAYYRDDLLDAPKNIAKAQTLRNISAITVRYEKLVLQPEEELRRVTDFLGLPFIDSMVNYGKIASPQWKYGDQGRVKSDSRPASDGAQAWKQRLRSPRIWRLAQDYLDMLGEEVLTQLGYPLEDCTSILEKHRPRRVNSKPVLEDIFSAASFLQNHAFSGLVLSKLIRRIGLRSTLRAYGWCI